MTQLTFSEVEEWLDAHPELSQDYFLRKTDLGLVNSWLVSHGFLTINDYVNGSSRRGSDTSGNVSPNGGYSDDTQSLQLTQNIAPTILPRRNSSKRCLRHDFARSKSRSVYRTHEVITKDAPSSSSRRSSLKDMRKYTSLPPNSINMLSLLIESKVRLPQCTPHSRATKRELLRSQGERDFFLAIVRDVATDLDLKSLSQKTVDNLTVLLDADGASLFLVDGPRGGRQTLVSKVFDVHSGASRFLLPGGGASGDNEVQVPWGVGVLGHVADTGETVNLQIACEDPRFDDEVDRIMGYHTESLLCMPVRNAYDEIIAVAQVVNKNPDRDNGHFTSKDEKLFETYLQFVGIAITNAQIVETSRQEYDRNRNLLEVVHDLFEEQTSLEKVILKTMQRAQKLLKCERAAVLLVDELDSSESVKFSKLFELNSPSNGQTTNNKCRQGVENSNVSQYLLSLAERVAASGEVINVAECVEVEKGTAGNVRSLLAMPVRNRNYQTIGVASIINKLNGLPFDETDEQLFEAFTIFCGLGIHNTLMYNEVEKAMARQKVTIEVLSYHATASSKEVEALLEKPVPGADELNLYSLSFDDFSLSQDEMLLAAVSMFLELGLVKKFNIERETLYRFLITVRRNYRDVPYHNWRHAFNVAQVMFAILMGCEMKGTFSDLEVLGMFVGCLCHDLDHRGTNNAFQQKTGSALVLLYGTTNTMEHHHFNHAVMILSSESHNIFSSLTAENYSTVMNVLKHSILATDLSTYFQLRPRFFSLVESRLYSWGLEEHRDLLRSMLMTASDIAASSKPWPVQERVAQLVATEFLKQGDKERNELKIQPQALMDRERQHELPQLQIRWIADICLPLYQSLGQMNPKLNVMTEGALENMAHWARLAASGNYSVKT
ncbi:dual 3',5'-cyclic-AMP and -GMP phosphodiesterase 11A-like [Lycorma delicatula]|uniref:dual 3',5'-cyclic-AMP and -GMP phosphodiesterase 11A-like n=1 Tax=Lycorma delicatula TaxID=130591 RepID=UPI003F512225